jgi:hypothetical protein
MHENNLNKYGGIKMTSDEVAKQINSGVEQAEKELEEISFVKKSGRKDRRNDDVFNQIGL